MSIAWAAVKLQYIEYKKSTLIKEVFYHYFYAKNKSIATATEDSSNKWNVIQPFINKKQLILI